MGTEHAALKAMRAGDGRTLLATLERTRDLKALLHALGRADDRRWDVRSGRSLLVASDLILSQPVEHIVRLLPILAIAASREGQYESAAKRARANAVIDKLRPHVAQSEDAADLIARSSSHAMSKGEAGQARMLFDLARECAAMKSNKYFIEMSETFA